MTFGYADEYGNNSFDFETQGSHFIITCILIKDKNDLPAIEAQIEEIRRLNFQTGEIKSSKVANNHSRRLKILNELIKVNFSIFAVVIDKRSLHGEGFNYKKSFYKFINNLLYKELFRSFPELQLNVDEHGSNSFMIEFKNYVEKTHHKTLFSGIEFNQTKSHNSILIQVADFFAGTLGYVYDETKKSDKSGEFLNLIKPKIALLNTFPRQLKAEEFDDSTIGQVFDNRIANGSFQRVFDFLEKNIGSDLQQKDQISFLKLLLWLQRANSKNSYISTKEIMRHMNIVRERPINEEYFRTKIVGNLRDKGVLIASSPNGYKIPTNAKDLENFIKLGYRIIMPMLNRIKEARNAIKLMTHNELDIIGNDYYKELRELLND